MSTQISGKVYQEVYEVLKVKKEIAQKLPEEDLKFIYQRAMQTRIPIPSESRTRYSRAN